MFTSHLSSICASSFSTVQGGDRVIRTSVFDPQFVKEVEYASVGLVNNVIELATDFMMKPDSRSFDVNEIVDPLRALSQEITRCSNVLADIECRWTSRSWSELNFASLPKASETIKWFCDVAQIAFKRFDQLPAGSRYEYHEDPLGVVAAITPWNDPLVAFAWKVVPALISGNCVIWKPSEHCIETAYWTVQQLYKFGLPRERLQLLLGDRTVGDALVRGCIDAVSFTGSTLTARQIVASANNDKLVKMHIEGGGKGCAIIGEDESDDELLHHVKILSEAAFSNQGQICSAPTVVLAPPKKIDSLIRFFKNIAPQYLPNDPTKHSLGVGVLVSDEKKKALEDLIAAESSGEALVLATAHEQARGLRPTLILNPHRKSRLVTDELFGPIVVVLPYTELEEAFDFINRQKYGLANGLFSHNHAVQDRFSNAVTGGILHINSWGTDEVGVPFGGVRNSGFGKEKTHETLTFFTNLKPICRP